jgi:hypothetical protein
MFTKSAVRDGLGQASESIAHSRAGIGHFHEIASSPFRANEKIAGMSPFGHLCDVARSRMDFRFGCESGCAADIVIGPKLTISAIRRLILLSCTPVCNTSSPLTNLNHWRDIDERGRWRARHTAARRLFEAAMLLDGVARRPKNPLGSSYRSGRSRDWLKMKNPAAPAVKREAEEDWGEERWR